MSIVIKNDKESDVTARLYLEKTEYGIALKADDASGDDWLLLTINEDGEVLSHASVPDALGIEVDDEGHLNISKEY